MHVVSVPKPRPQPAQESAVRPWPLAHCPLDERVDEDARHIGVAGCQPKQLNLWFTEALVELWLLALDQRRQLEVFTLLGRQPEQIKSKVNIDVQTNLVTRVVLDHRAAAWLAHIADRQQAEPGVLCALRERLDEADQVRVTVVPVSLDVNRLVAGAIGG